MTITDSKANRLSRDADAQQQDVGRKLGIFHDHRVDDNTTDVVYEHCAGYESKSHAGFLMAHWARLIVLLFDESKLLSLPLGLNDCNEPHLRNEKNAFMVTIQLCG